MISMLFLRYMLFVFAVMFLVIYYLNYFWYKEKLVSVLSELSYTSCSEVDQKKMFSAPRDATKSMGAIGMLVGNNYTILAMRLSSLDKHLLDNTKNDVIIFHTGYPSTHDISLVLNSTKRHVVFINVDRELSSFPTSFDPYSTQPTWTKRGKWNYHHMLRFWFKLVFELCEVQKYDYLMRLDDDSRLLGTWINVFEIMRKEDAVYLANEERVDYENGLPGTMKLKEVSLSYKTTGNISSVYQKRVESAFVRNGAKSYYNNFEVMKVHFFLQADLRNWMQMIDDSHGIYKYRWGDAILRRLTLTIFARPEQILHRHNYNLPYCHPC